MQTGLNILLATVGSAGDVHPFVGLGVELKRRGHRVTLITSGAFENLARKAGLEFKAYLSAEEYHALIQDPRVWHRVDGFKTVMQQGMTPSLRPIYQAICELHVPGRTVIAASSLAFAAQAAHEKLGAPLATIHLSPALFRSDFENPVLPGLFLPPWLPAPLKRAQYWLVDRAMVDRIMGPPLNEFRAELGLPPQRRFLRDGIHSPQRVIGLFPDWFAPRQSDWPEQVVLTGFPRYDERDVSEPDGPWRQFLAEGDPPIVFTPGSAMVHGREFFQAAIDACGQLGRRGMLLTRYPEQLPPDLPPSVRHFDFVPLSVLLPQAAALVHHGGIGTLSQGLAAGIPQLIMPMSHDQPDNAHRLKRLGVGASLAPHRFRGPAVAARLNQLLSSALVAERCREIAARFHADRALSATCDLLEAMANQFAPDFADQAAPNGGLATEDLQTGL
jgi:UDP:flavonoid glycosyltransferase YjiC (YdhE family)